MSTLLLQQVSHNLDSIQKAVTQKCCTTIFIITQQSHTDNMNWKLIEHIIVTATETEEMQSTNFWRLYKSVHCISFKTDEATEQMNQNVDYTFVHSSIIVIQLQECFHDWASYKQSWLHLNRDSSLFLSYEYHRSLYNYWEVEACMICQKFSTESWSDV
jgi:hypothetical protein